MDTIRLPARQIPVMAETEVLVVGAGPAGLAAALGAARAGADVLLLERYGYVGGQATGGLVLSLPCARRLAAEDPSVTIEPPTMMGAVTNEIHERLLAIGGGRTGSIKERYRSMWYPEELKWLGLEMIKEAQVKPLFHSTAVNALLEEQAIVTVVAFSIVATWNNFMGPLIYLNSTKKLTISVGLSLFRQMAGDTGGFTPFGQVMAASVTMLIPMVALFLAAQRYFIVGITMTGIKG